VQWCQTVTFKSLQCHPGLTYIFYFCHSGIWRSGLSARVPECQKLKMEVRPGWQNVTNWQNFPLNGQYYCTRHIWNNDVLPLIKAAQRDAIENWKSLGRPTTDTSDLISIVPFFIRYVAPPYSAGTVIMASVYGRRVKLPVLFFVIWHSFVEMRTVTKYVVLASQFLGRTSQILNMQLQIRFTSQVPTCRKAWLSSDLRVRSLAMK